MLVLVRVGCDTVGAVGGAGVALPCRSRYSCRLSFVALFAGLIFGLAAVTGGWWLALSVVGLSASSCSSSALSIGELVHSIKSISISAATLFGLGCGLLLVASVGVDSTTSYP